MRILYDNQIFETQKVGGISRYFVELIKQFRRFKNVEINFPIAISENIYLKELSFLKNIKRPTVLFDKFLFGLRFPGRGRLYRYLYLRENKEKVIDQLKKGDFEIFHPAYYSPYFLKYIGDRPFILNVYDVAHERYNKDMHLFDHSAKNKRKLIHRASKIIVMSQNTKKDIINLYSIPEEKISVIYLANSLKKTKIIPRNISQLPEKYILFVGGRAGYKNFNLFVKSIAPLLQKHKDIFLVCVGHPFNKEENLMLERLKIKNRLKHYSVNDSTLSYIYQKATCFVFPSLYEGFGMPTLEAFSCGCPVVLSNYSCMSEVGGDAAIYFDPEDGGDILKKVKMVIGDEKLRKRMIKKGYEQNKKFSWGKCAEETKKVYEKVLREVI